MWFVDQAEISVAAGIGGNGSSAMAKPPGSRYPRRTGGDGGDGGAIVLVTDPHLTTLLDFQYRREFRADRGRHGSGNTRTGRRGAETVIRVPPGTVVRDAETGEVLGDLTGPREHLLIARGGRGGVGNARAARATPGRPGEQRRLRLELKLLADVGIIGFPNAGKSSLLARISTARPKIAPYPFTTLVPVLGVVAVDHEGAFVACDIPGLIEGAHAGRGLGSQFLRHIERTRLLLHVVEMDPAAAQDPATRLRRVNAELAAHRAELAGRPQCLVANKMDVPGAQDVLTRFRRGAEQPVYPVSCATGAGIAELIQEVWRRIEQLRPPLAGAAP